jgi:hypothetical protein
MSHLRTFLSKCENKFVVLSTNVDRKDWFNVFGPRVESRLAAGKRFDTKGIPDYRVRKGEK